MARIAVLGSFRLPPERLEQARPAMVRVIEATLAEDGCVAYSYAEDVADPGLIRVSEMWESREHLAAHFQTPHMHRWAEERTALDLSNRDISAYEVSEAETL
ncbi:MAG TPA: putative quinol monooxygenase [Sphingomonadaceae bacterium]|nr:putative quinol monooxygenase [Sphingomonadaceae bacterium]